MKPSPIDVRLVVVESSFNDVMRAMYKTIEATEDGPNDVIRISNETPPVISNPISPIDGQAKRIIDTQSDSQPSRTKENIGTSENQNLTGLTGTKDEKENTTGDIVINSMTPVIEKETK